MVRTRSSKKDGSFKSKETTSYDSDDDWEDDPMDLDVSASQSQTNVASETNIDKTSNSDDHNAAVEGQNSQSSIGRHTQQLEKDANESEKEDDELAANVIDENAHDDHDESESDNENENENENEDADMMASIYRTHADNYSDDHNSHDDHEEEEEEEDDDSPADAFAGALRSLANNMGARSRGGAHNGSSLAENMARIFPETMGLFETMRGGSSNELRDLIRGLSRRDDSYLLLETLNQLSQRFLMLNPLLAETAIPENELSRALVDIMNEPAFYEEMQLQLVACRCMYNFIEINPNYISSLIRAGAIDALQSKLMEISFIDLAEQALQTLEFIARFSGREIFRKNCLTSCLQYLDFFTIHAQRKAILITANSVKDIRLSEFHLVEEILPTLHRVVLEYSDSQLVDTAWLAIARIVKNFRSTTNLEKIATPELLQKILLVISNTDTSLQTNLRLINTLWICAENQALASTLIQNDQLVPSLTNSFLKYKKGSDSSITIELLMAAPKDLVLAILNLLIVLLPAEDNSVLTKSPVGPKKDYSDIADSYKSFVNGIFPLLTNIYQSSVVYDIRLRVIVCLIRLVSSLRSIKDLENSTSIINLLASIVIQNKSLIRTEKTNLAPYVNLFGALVVTEAFIEKEPDIFISEFEREGLLSDTSSLLEVLRAEDSSVGQVQPSENVTDDHDSDDFQSEEEHDEENESEENEDSYDEPDFDSHEEELEQISLHARYRMSEFKVKTVPEMLHHLTEYASKIEQIYLSKKAAGSSKLENLRLLDELSSDLTNERLVSSYNYKDWVNIWKNFQSTLSKDSYVISSFELISSGIIEVLNGLFGNVKYGSEGSVCRTAFLDSFQGESFEVLIQKLQEALTRSELFEIIGCGLKTGENKVTSLSKQLKVKLSVIDDEAGFFGELREFVILVHAIAGLNNIGTFLKRRTEGPFLFGARSGAQLGSQQSNWYVEFLLDDEVIPADTTIYGALYKHLQNKNPKFDTNKFWREIHEIKFRKVEGTPPAFELDDRYPESSESDFEAGQHTKTLEILNLLKVLHDLNGQSKSFFNYKLTAKLKRQLEEPLIVASGILPAWSIHITRKYPFLFPLETRTFFLQSTSFGYSRLVQLWNNRVNQEGSNSNDNDGENVPLGRPTKYKVRVSRNHLLQSAYKVLEKLGSNPGILEIEFNEEVGTGLGPTLEFYSIVSHLFAQNKLGIWRTDESSKDAEYAFSENGLFPAPLVPTSKNYNTRIEHFRYLGKLIARALLDNRIMDINLNKLFFELASSEVDDQDYSLPKAAAFEKIKSVDESLYKSLKYLQDNKSTVADLSITFLLPGYEDIELKPNGGDILVTEENVDEYIERVVDLTVGSGIKEQIQTFIAGFSEVFPFYSLLIFSPSELVQLLGKAEEDWSYETLVSSIHADHGYTITSPRVQNLLLTMSQFSTQERRLFLQFLTGSPRLPIGGFQNLKPAFTVVLKHSEDGLKPDDYLPSVMTCANYLKLPNYSSLEVLQQRINQAINEGAGAFLLS